MNRFLFTVLLSCIACSVSAQRVGLVLSGGGAKGLYHIGVIRALEENGIPIDYVSGTSMGAIVGGMYAAAFTPEEMEEFFMGDSWKLWLSGKIEDKYSYFFSQKPSTSSMISLRLDFSNTKNIAKLPTNLVPPYQMDLAFTEILGGVNAQIKGDFDSLLVPFRCIASDVYNKREVVCRSGDLGAAIRMSMTFPFVFKPLKIDSLLMYDGGIYNNFPWQVQVTDFNPDIIIGCKCVADSKIPDENNVMEQLDAMTTKQTDYNLPKDKGIMISRVFSDVGLLDFDKAKYIMDQGYVDAMAMMPEIKERVRRRVSSDDLLIKRLSFKSKTPDLIFDKYNISGLNQAQTTYVDRMLKMNKRKSKSKDFTFNDFKSAYFKLLSEDEIKGEFPTTTYNDTTGKFAINMTMTTEPSFKVNIGGNISSATMNQAYVGVEYKRMGLSAQNYSVDGYFGQLYSSVKAGLRSDFYLYSPFYLSAYYIYNHYNYFRGNADLMYMNRASRYYKTNDNYLTVALGLPLSRRSVGSLSGNIGSNSYDYYQRPDFVYDDTPDRTRFDFFQVKAEVELNTLDQRLYPVKGTHQTISLLYVNGNEGYYPGVYQSHASSMGRDIATQHWWGARFKREEYFRVSKWFRIGYLFDLTITTHPKFENSYADNVTQPAFTPTPHSTTLYLPQFRSNSFLGAGIMPTFMFTDNFYLKNEVFVFLPEDYLKLKDINVNPKYIISSSFVYQTPVGPASFTVANYDMKSKWYVVFNFGFVLFNKRGISY